MIKVLNLLFLGSIIFQHYFIYLHIFDNILLNYRAYKWILDSSWRRLQYTLTPAHTHTQTEMISKLQCNIINIKHHGYVFITQGLGTGNTK